jgi:hypothetical protein
VFGVVDKPPEKFIFSARRDKRHDPHGDYAISFSFRDGVYEVNGPVYCSYGLPYAVFTASG